MFRELRVREWFHSLLGDCRFGRRQIRKSPIFTAVAVLTLALGIGSSTAIFSTIDTALLHPYPYKNADRLATFRVFAADQFRAWRFPARAFVAFKDHNRTFDDMFGLVYREERLSRTGDTDEFSGGSVTPGTFESLGIPPLRGRAFTADDYKLGAPPVFVISYSLWTKLFNRDPNILGTTYTLNGTRMALVGIMPARFQIGGCDLWLPLDITKDTFVPGAGIEPNEIWTVGHLKAGVSRQTAAADLQIIATPFEKDDPIYFPARFKIVVDTFNSQSVGGDFKLGLFALMGAVMMLLLIACSNVVNLLLARATTREREFGIRSALGASRGRLIRQLLVESFALASVSCALGCLLAFCGLKVIVALIPSQTIPQEAVVSLSPGALLFSLAVTIFVTFACGLAPALHAFRTDAQTALCSAGRGTSEDFRHGKLALCPCGCGSRSVHRFGNRFRPDHAESLRAPERQHRVQPLESGLCANIVARRAVRLRSPKKCYFSHRSRSPRTSSRRSSSHGSFFVPAVYLGVDHSCHLGKDTSSEQKHGVHNVYGGLLRNSEPASSARNAFHSAGYRLRSSRSHRQSHFRPWSLR